ncbi:CheR family methyltransferase [Alkalihalobacterium bogoriense]|uniref:CheR family methyltransferase n=1 Tax=Alkalihalobacterium bogoriense TaxID=246272 RepID=UPI000479D162|nr:protein-glutamate O-methyltransferase CheR [Alkalihalobacterium bogoriense]
MENFALNQFGQLVYQYCGLNYLQNLPSLQTKIAKRLQEMNMSLWNYMQFIENTPKEWDIIVELLTINETYFYREDKQLSVFQEVVLPTLVKEERPIKIWSAACSTGEEPYSLAMTSLDSAVFPLHQIQIVATDINKRVLQIANKGKYSKSSLSFRRIPQRWLQDYFIENETDYTVADHIKERISFQYLNLLDENSMKQQQQFDVIFCRNVLIYFDTETIKKVATSFYHSLKQGGLLFLGHAENISTMGIGFETISTNGTFYYRKG